MTLSIKPLRRRASEKQKTSLMHNGGMAKKFTGVPDPSRGAWLRPLETEHRGSIPSLVPRGYEMYARVFHPVDRDRPRATRTWCGVDGAALERAPATWAEAAASFGTALHAEAQFASIVRQGRGTDAEGVAPDGWRYSDAPVGSLAPSALTAVSAVLAHHTATPDAGIAAVWEGWGGLVNSAGVAQPDSNGGLTAPPDVEPGSGLLAQEIVTGPRFKLHGQTGRNYFLFEAGAGDFADGSWSAAAPWVDGPCWAQSPNILWPDDHVWMPANEIDFDSTLIGGTAELIRELVQTPGIAALPIRLDAGLRRDGDTLNRSV